MAKRSHPALYEVIRKKGPLVAPSTEEREAPPPAPVSPARLEPAPVSAPPPSAEPAMPALLTPGRTVRVPVGYVWISIGAVIAAVVLSYVVGHGAGRSVVERERERELADAVAAAERGADGAGAGVARDPLRDPAGAGGTGDQSRTGAGGTPRSTPPVIGGATGLATPLESRDPRIDGHHYYVLAHGTEAGAPRMAEFLREHGVDARVVPDHNGRLRKVIALPGLADRADQSTPAAVALRASIEEGLRKWRQASGDRTRRSPDYYLEQHGAPQRR